MEKKNYTGIVPGQHTGKEINTQTQITCETAEQATALYQAAKQRLLDVNHWHEFAGKALAVFHLTDAKGHPVQRSAQKGDHFKIDIPGPGSKTGEGYDWVHVESVEETSNSGIESIGIRVRPAPNPQNTDKEVAHFYSDQSTSNFIVTREGNTLTASVYDRNTEPNKDAGNTADKIRNSTIGAGAVTLFSKIQWKSWVDGLLKKS